MKIAIFAYSRQGCKTARAIMEHFKAEEIRAFTKERFEESGFQPLCRHVPELECVRSCADIRMVR